MTLRPELPDAPRRVESRYGSWLESWWKSVAAGTTALILALAALAIALQLARALALVFLAVTIAAALAPLVSWLERWIPRTMAAVLIYLALLAAIVGIVVAVTPPLYVEARAFQDRLPELFTQTEERLREYELLDGDRPLQGQLSDVLSEVGGRVVEVPLTIFSATIEVLMVFVISLYVLIEGKRIRAFIFSFIPVRLVGRAEDIARQLVSATGGYVRGVLLESLIIGSISYIGFMVIGLEFALILALFNGAAEIFPIIGPIVGMIPPLVVALVDSPTKALITLVFVIALQQLESNLITPLVMHHQIEVSPLLVVIAIFVGGAVAGIVGALVALPLMAVLRVLVSQLIAPALRRATGASPS